MIYPEFTRLECSTLHDALNDLSHKQKPINAWSVAEVLQGWRFYHLARVVAQMSTADFFGCIMQMEAK